MLRVTPAIEIADAELEERFVRASGPGGQNVNKVATAVELRFDAAHSPALTDEIRTRLRAIAGSRMTADGVLVIDARRFRTQADNREDARDRLASLDPAGRGAPTTPAQDQAVGGRRGTPDHDEASARRNQAAAYARGTRRLDGHPQ